MRHYIYGADVKDCKIAILVKENAFQTNKIEKAYIKPTDRPYSDFIAYSLWYNDKNKCPVSDGKDYLKTILHSVKSLGIKTILVCDSNYFKFLTGEKRSASSRAGYATPSAIEGYEGEFTVFYAPNYQAAEYNPRPQQEMETAMASFKNYLAGQYVEPGQSVIHSAQYPSTLSDVEAFLAFLHTKDKLTVDIETRGLEFWNCGIATISFAWDMHNFGAIAVDRGEFSSPQDSFPRPWNFYVKGLLKLFFQNYEGTMIAHNANFDFKVLVYELFMKDLQDYPGMIFGIETLTRCFEDTKVVTYLATNNAVENNLKLKVVAAEFMGDYAEEVTDTDSIPLPDLLEYNGRDTLATWYVMRKHWDTMIKDNQYGIYTDLFKPSVITILAQELVGMPIFPDKVAKARKQLEKRHRVYHNLLMNSTIIKEFTLQMQQEACKEFTEKAKKKVFQMDDPRVQRIVFNPASNPQVGKLLHEYLGLPILDYTDTKQPAVGQKTLAKLLNHTNNDHYRKIIRALIGLAQVDKILTSFIPAFEKAVLQPDGSYRLYGSFNLGGTLSGRLSSSDPNLQNLPSHSSYAKLIKRCFGCIKGWLFGGADFNSLEDMVSALTTRDPNKMAVYLEGYDGHCLRAYFYFGNQMPDIIHEVSSVNSIKKKYPHLRQKSKTPTFLLTYQGTFHGLMNSLGLSEDEALRIEAAYHEMYKVSDEWVAKRLKQACKDGYVTGAFGLRLRTPLLKANGPDKKLGYMAQKEGRTAGNMLGQSYGMLNSRAANEFREKVWASKYRHDIFLCSQIHDATYMFWRNKAGIAKWINDTLISCMEWDGLVELQHPTVKVGAELDIYFPDWSKATTIKNKATLKEILDTCQ